MTLDPNLAGMLTMLASHGGGSLSAGTVEQARANLRLVTVDLRPPAMKPAVRSIEPLTIPGPAGDLPARVYRPETEGPLPTLVFFHGGGFVVGDLDTHDDTCRRLANDVEAVVVSVGYRLAPEDRWPAAPDDAEAATRWVAAHLADFGGAAGPLAVGGDSAGGNLSAVVAQQLRGSDVTIAAQFLAYPAVDFNGSADAYPSRIENAEGYFLTLADMLWFALEYTPAGTDETSAILTDPRLSPIRGDLAGLPPAVVVTAQYDPLRDEGEAYAKALEAAGVTVIAERFDGLIHGFLDLGLVSPACDAATAASYAALRKLLWS